MHRKAVKWPSTKLILSHAINLGLLMLCWSGVALAIGSVSRRRGFAGAFGGLLALATLLLDYVGRLWPSARISRVVVAVALSLLQPV